MLVSFGKGPSAKGAFLIRALMPVSVTFCKNCTILVANDMTKGFVEGSCATVDTIMAHLKPKAAQKFDIQDLVDADDYAEGWVFMLMTMRKMMAV